jgi:hypothetical protein
LLIFLSFQIKTIVEDSDVASFTFLRFALASLIALPYLPGLTAPLRLSSATVKGADQSVATSGNITTTTNNKSINMSSEPSAAWRWGMEVR